MSPLRPRTIIVSAVAILAFAVCPTAALAGSDASVSAVDAVAASTAESTSSSDSTASSAADSPTVDSYSGGGCSTSGSTSTGSSTCVVPPPVDCSTPTTGSSTGSSTGTSTGGGATAPASGGTTTSACTPITECSEADLDHKDAAGNSCTITTKTDTPPVVTGGGDVVDTPVGTPVATPLQPVSGGGAPATAPMAPVSGGGTNLPFTGLPLIYAIYGGLGLVLLGGILWFRSHRTSKP